MLDDAVAAYLDSVSERAFDEPLVALLRAQGFSDVHLVHGAREFGKDVIGRRDGAQWAFQSKAGNISQSAWRELRGQLDELRLVDLGHGSFDTGIPRKPVLVTTGRLTGNAPDLYRDYNEQAIQKGEPTLGLWDHDVLLGYLGGDPQAVLRGSMDGQLLSVLGSADEGSLTMRRLEVFSRRWTAWQPERLSGLGVIEAALLCERLRAADRLDLACYVPLCLVRGCWASGSTADFASAPADAARSLFEAYARELWDKGKVAAGKNLLGRTEFGAWVTYPVRCLRLAELVGLLSLHLRDSDAECSAESAEWLAAFVKAHPGAAHPISDQYAVSMIPPILALAATDRKAAMRYLTKVTVWVADRYERDQLGLADVHATTEEEIEYLIGAPFEAVELEKRRDSLTASVLLDLCASLDADELYADVYNDLKAVKVFPYLVRLSEGPDQYLLTGESNRLDPNVDFAEELVAGGPIAPHHADLAGRQQVEDGRAWDLIAVGSVLRDRYFVGALEALVPSPT